MAKSITVSFSDRADDQERLSQVGGSITFDKYGCPVFSFPSMDAYREWQRRGTEAYLREVAAK
ncbi:hypothetical protein QRX25_10140 [Bacillus sp. L381]|uniref:hypothetical protein n=1 Tax=Bacillus TaxID=1386 RepID=UPI000C1A197F|nr:MULTISPECIES: hypothetical protein [Bacillus]PIK29457.1 hypothetical protein CS954_18360 [Bacillus siamensis]MCR9038566.1 hypothetical protein [Bacillus velezensis]QPK87255.1 hypothetical protein IEN91_11500 [Bacillus velezensis]QUN07917.1 hypothetical protein KEF49_09995 [Bacillus amyloliquefaciens]QYM83239.1 hypothetical protein KTJ85_02880 [Bacillus sp. 7D3]